MIDVARDTVGIRLAAIEVLEESFEAARIERTLENASAETRARLLASVPQPGLATGYLRWCEYLWALESELKAVPHLEGIGTLEVRGLVAIHAARREWESRHPECSRCKARQSTRFATQCEACKGKFTGRK